MGPLPADLWGSRVRPHAPSHTLKLAEEKMCFIFIAWCGGRGVIL